MNQMNKNMDDINVILATDCGSTTTKAILIEKTDGEYRLTDSVHRRIRSGQQLFHRLGTDVAALGADA